MDREFVLCYQMGIANLLELSDNKYKRLYQGDYRTAENRAIGLALAAYRVTIIHCDLAGDILLQSGHWQSGAGTMWSESKLFKPEHRMMDRNGKGLTRDEVIILKEVP